MKDNRHEAHNAKDSSQLAHEIRRGVRELIKGDADLSPGSHLWRNLVKPFLSPQEKHETKKKFLTYDDAIKWHQESGYAVAVRPYRCNLCPFFHLSSKNAK